MPDPMAVGDVLREDGAVDGEALRDLWLQRGEALDLAEGGDPEETPEAALRVWCAATRIPPRYMRAEAGMLNPCQEYHRYLAGAERNWREGLGLMMFGPTGTGKSMAMAHLLKHCWTPEAQPTALWVSEADLVEAAKPDGRQDLVQKAKTVQVLAMDDFGVSRLTDFVVELFDGIAERRHKNNLCLLMTTNLTPIHIEENPILARIWRRWSQDCAKAIMRKGVH